MRTREMMIATGRVDCAFLAVDAYRLPRYANESGFVYALGSTLA